MTLIRPAVRDDIAAVALLVEAYWRFQKIDGYVRPFVERQLLWIQEQPQLGRCWVAHAAAGGTIVGYLLAVCVFSLEYGGMIAEIDELFVVPEHRAHGTGAQLLQAAERDLANSGCRMMQLQLGTDNDAARGFYRRFGYRERIGYEMLVKPLSA